MANNNLNTLNVKTLNYTGDYIYHRGVPVEIGGGGGTGAGATGAQGDTGAQGATGVGATGAQGATGAGSSYWASSGSDIYNTNTGHVGIGTGATGPTRTLDVSGNTRLRGYLFVGSPDSSGNPGDVLTVSHNYQGLQWAPFTPPGSIIIWTGFSTASLPYQPCYSYGDNSGNPIPDWYVCTGQSVSLPGGGSYNTPNLRNTFIRGAANFSNPLSEAAGSNKIAADQLPKHGHNITDPSHKHNLTINQDGTTHSNYLMSYDGGSNPTSDLGTGGINAQTSHNIGFGTGSNNTWSGTDLAQTGIDISGNSLLFDASGNTVTQKSYYPKYQGVSFIIYLPQL